MGKRRGASWGMLKLLWDTFWVDKYCYICLYCYICITCYEYMESNLRVNDEPKMNSLNLKDMNIKIWKNGWVWKIVTRRQLRWQSVWHISTRTLAGIHIKNPRVAVYISNPSVVGRGINSWELLASKYSWISKFQASKRPCLKKQYGWLLRNNSQGWPVVSTYMGTQVNMLSAQVHKDTW